MISPLNAQVHPVHRSGDTLVNNSRNNIQT